MTTRTRYFVIASLLVLGVGMGAGLVAYYAGFPMSAFARSGGPDELKYVPSDATVLAYADVRAVMSSELRRKLHQTVPMYRSLQRRQRLHGRRERQQCGGGRGVGRPRWGSADRYEQRCDGHRSAPGRRRRRQWRRCLEQCQ